ncbi:MAG: class I tRNA ligase family protein [Thermoplasmata archaeon]|nr:class I tRNA ligase family protein [Thermoplasmata archaeon]
MDPSRERHWQEAWARAGLARAVRADGQPKFYALHTYPTPSGFLHVGHFRGLTVADVLHRYHRMKGYRVFFPNGTHGSGLPTVTFAQRVKDREPIILEQLREAGVPESEWAALADPEAAVRFLGRTYLELFRRFGLLIDERAYVTTVDEDYRSFIRWQFHRLHDRGALVKGPYFAAVCPVCGPVSVDASETDLSSGGDAERVIYTAISFRLPDGRYLLTATLRPETIYGVTNLWITEDGWLVPWTWNEKTYLVSPAAGQRLVEQLGGHLGKSEEVTGFHGVTVRAPLSGHEVPVLRSPVVDAAIGTGVVMSVPAHAPADWLAVTALPPSDRDRLPPIPTIVELPDEGTLTSSERELRQGHGPPAQRAVTATGANTLADEAQLEAATERLYRLEFVRGRMRADLLGGAPVGEARLAASRALASAGEGFEFHEFDRPVICRNGHAVVIRRIDDQWFLHYGDPEWKNATRELVARLATHPEEYASELPGILDWFQDRPCTRRGRWLGTKFPYATDAVIEPIADSTFYPAYFVVRPYVADGRLPLSALTDAFFDFVFLGEGTGEPSVDRALIEEVRREFLYWYPLDLNLGGKEHKRVHFPAFLYTHVKLLPPELQPRGLFVHSWLTGPGGSKISKKEISSKGGKIPPVDAAIDRWGADGLRLFLLTAASPYQDVEWDPEVADAAQRRLVDVERLVRTAQGDGSGGPPELDAWLLSSLRSALERAVAGYADFALREVAEAVYVTLPALQRRYLARGGSPGPALQKLAGVWVRMLVPMTPHLAEELGDGRESTLVSALPFPDPADLPHAPSAVAAEEYLDRVEEDLRSVLRPAEVRGEVPDGVTFFIAEPWKRTVEQWLREGLNTPAGGPAIRSVMERAKAHPDLRPFLAEIPTYVERLLPQLRSDASPTPPEVDEAAILRSAEGYLARRFNFGFVGVHRESLGADHDPLERRHRARPGRPAFYLVPGGAGRAVTTAAGDASGS